jgi:uncharacterized protein YdeI (BOF family)
MKKIAIIAVMCVFFAGALSAQDVRANVETTTISGKLAVANGLIALQSGEQLYYVHGFQHLINFIDGLKEGAEVTLEGYIVPFQNDSETLHFMATKLTMNGKSYDLQTPYGNRGMGFNRGTRFNRNMECWNDDSDWQHHRNRHQPRMNRR